MLLDPLYEIGPKPEGRYFMDYATNNHFGCDICGKLWILMACAEFCCHATKMKQIANYKPLGGHAMLRGVQW